MKTLLGTTEVSLTTDAAAVTAPAMDSYATTVVAGCRSAAGAWIEWIRLKAAASATSTPCINSKESVECMAHSGQTVFYAKVAADTGTLHVEWWG